MIDIIYQTLLTILRKEINGYVSPNEFNTLAAMVQNEIYRSYFEDYNLDKHKGNRGMVNKGYANLIKNQGQRITMFATEAPATKVGPSIYFDKPSDIYLLEDDGIWTLDGKVVEEVERGSLRWVLNSEAAPTELYPVYEDLGDTFKVYPDTITEVLVRYLRKPKNPMWTYYVLPNGKELFDPSNGSYQDFELHPSEYSNIILRMLTYFGISLREEEVVQVAEVLKDKQENKDNN